MSIFDGNFCAFRSRTVTKLDLFREVAEFGSEFIGTMLFAFFGGLAPGGAAPLGNGVALAVLVYCTASMSGGKLNPAVSLAVYALDFINAPMVYLVKLLVDWTAQITGAMAGAAIAYTLAGNVSVGCFIPPAGLTQSRVFGLETMATLLLVFTVLSTAVELSTNAKFGVMAPLAIGLSLFVAATAVGGFTGGSLNPARYLGALVGAKCGKPSSKYAMSYIGGEFLGAILALFIHTGREFVREWYAGCFVPDLNKIAASKPPPAPSAASMPAGQTAAVGFKPNYGFAYKV